jgi:hypothetical protein
MIQQAEAMPEPEMTDAEMRAHVHDLMARVFALEVEVHEYLLKLRDQAWNGFEYDE